MHVGLKIISGLWPTMGILVDPFLFHSMICFLGYPSFMQYVSVYCFTSFNDLFSWLSKFHAICVCILFCFIQWFVFLVIIQVSFNICLYICLLLHSMICLIINQKELPAINWLGKQCSVFVQPLAATWLSKGGLFTSVIKILD